MMFIPTLLGVLSLALCVASDSPYSDYVDRFFNLFGEAVQSGDSDAIGRYISDSFKFITPGDQYNLKKGILLRTLSYPELRENTKLVANNVSESNGVLSGRVLFVGKTKFFDTDFKLEIDSQNDAGYVLTQINAPNSIISGV